jgi:hypothetical protein
MTYQVQSRLLIFDLDENIKRFLQHREKWDKKSRHKITYSREEEVIFSTVVRPVILKRTPSHKILSVMTKVEINDPG